MHKDDQMTPNERLAGFFAGKEIDRLPAMPFVVSVAGKVCGMTHREKRSTAKTQAQAQIETYEKLGHDGLTVEWGLHGVGHACGSVWNDPEDGVPAIVDHVMKSMDDLEKLDLDMIRKDPWYQLNLDACKICVDKLSQEVGTNISTPGPFTAASSCYPVDKLLRATRREPEKVHQLLRFCTDAIKIAAEDFVREGGGIFLCDPIASGNIINKKTYREFVLPYTIEIADYVHSLGAGMGYHICGDTNSITEDMLESGCDMLSVDTKVNLADAKRVAGNRVPIIGNVDPIETMMLGTPETVIENMKQNLRDCWDSPKGYIVSTGCDIPINGPLENIYTFMDGVRKYAKYPLNPKNFE